MASLKRIFVLHTTGDHSDAGTDANFELKAENPGGHFIANFGDLPHDDRQKGRTDEYVFNVAGKGLTSKTKLRIRMTTSSDGWLPKTIWAIGETTANDYVVLAANTKWEKWFDRGDDPAGSAEHAIN